MGQEYIQLIIKFFSINIMIYMVNLKILGKEMTKKKLAIILFSSSITCMLGVTISQYIDNLLIIMIMYFWQLVVMKKALVEDKSETLWTANLISNAIVYTTFIASIIVEFPIIIIIKINNVAINFVLIFLIEALILIGFFNIKRFRKGFAFLKNEISNEYANVIMINVSTVVILAYYIFGNYYGNLTKQLLICLFVSSAIMIIMIQKTLTLYYKQKLLAKNIEEYKSEIALKDAQIKSLSDEKYKISKLNHEFYNRQKSLIHKVEEITSMNTEIADELDFSKQINDLTKEYTDKAQEIKTLDKLPTTGIVEIDDMFKYMQSECDSKKIQFNLKINGNIYHMINNKIPQSRLVTLIGDHLRDAIIAIDFSNNTFKSILAVLGENNGVYEFCVFDTGIEFKIDTLLNLGLKPATTHKDSGGTGIGFMTTFETMKETKASLIIDEMREMSNTDYTKSVTIRFDGKNEYRIKSYRSDEIKKKMKDNRIIIENKKGSSTQWN